MLVLGIDPGTAITGYGLVREHGDSLSLVTCGVIRTSSEEALGLRLQHIYQSLRSLMAEYRPAAIAIEELFFGSNARTAFAVGQARGVCLLAGVEANIPIYEYTPLEVKQALVGYGRATKEQVQHMVRMLLKLEAVPQPDDAADALAVAICHIHSIKMSALIGDPIAGR